MEVVLNEEQIARVCHEANRAYCMSIGDHSQSTWDMAPEWQKGSAVNGVVAVLDNPGRTPKDSHEGWLAEKQAAGWKHGPIKAPEKKEHPCMVPYHDLPDSQRIKDALFVSVVEALRPLTFPGKYPSGSVHVPEEAVEEDPPKQKARRKRKT